METLINTSLEAENIETANELRERLRDLCQRLNDEEMFELRQEFDLDHGMSRLSLKNEENSSYNRQMVVLDTADLEAIHRFLSDPFVRNQGGQRPGVTEAKHPDSD